MFKRKKKSKAFNFILSSKNYKNLHLMLYIMTLFVILFIYFLLLLIFHDATIRTFVFVFCSFVLGIFSVFKRDELVEEFSNWHVEHKRKKLKTESKENLKSTIKRIVPRNRNIKFNIKGKVSLKERFERAKINFKKPSSDKKKPDYIEIKD